MAIDHFPSFITDTVVETLVFEPDVKRDALSWLSSSYSELSLSESLPLVKLLSESDEFNGAESVD